MPTTASTRSLLRVPARARVSGRTAHAALVVALVVGILGMHALTSHGTPTTPVAASTTVGMTAMPEHESAPDAALAARAPHDADAEASATAGHDLGHDMTSMAMLCVAMLAGAAITVLRLLVCIRQPLLPAAFAPAATRARILQRVRGTGPPPAWQFSVIRC